MSGACFQAFGFHLEPTLFVSDKLYDKIQQVRLKVTHTLKCEDSVS